MAVNLPTPETNKGANDWGDVYSNDKALKDATETLEGTFPVTRANLASESKPVTWYTPKIIATEESRENLAFGTLTTPDEITSVVLPENGLMVVGYEALVKSSGAGAGSAALFLGGKQIKIAGSTSPEVQEVATNGTGFQNFQTTGTGLSTRNSGTSFVTTGQVLGNPAVQGTGGLCVIFAAAGTYNISVQFKASSGSVTAKERKLWAFILGY